MAEEDNFSRRFVVATTQRRLPVVGDGMGMANGGGINEPANGRTRTERAAIIYLGMRGCGRSGSSAFSVTTRSVGLETQPHRLIKNNLGIYNVAEMICSGDSSSSLVGL